jgi:hypothetical protein
VYEAKARPLWAFKGAEERARRFQKLNRSTDVRLDKRLGVIDGAVDVCFGGEVHQRRRLILSEQRIDCPAIPDIRLG